MYLLLLFAVITLPWDIRGPALFELYRVRPRRASHSRGARDRALLVFECRSCGSVVDAARVAPILIMHGAQFIVVKDGIGRVGGFCVGVHFQTVMLAEPTERIVNARISYVTGSAFEMGSCRYNNRAKLVRFCRQQYPVPKRSKGLCGGSGGGEGSSNPNVHIE